MSARKHDVESQGSKPRDHEHPRHHFIRHAHRDWRVWTAVMLMLAMILVYVMTDGLSVWPGSHTRHLTPAANAPR
jgi:hypothetical protein